MKYPVESQDFPSGRYPIAVDPSALAIWVNIRKCYTEAIFPGGLV